MVDEWVFEEIDPFLHNRPEYAQLPALYRGYSHDNQRFIFTLKGGDEVTPDVGRTINVILPDGVEDQFEEPTDAAKWVIDQLRIHLKAHGYLHTYHRSDAPPKKVPTMDDGSPAPTAESYDID